MFLMASIVLVTGCKKDTDDPDEGDGASCEGCHTNYAHLQKVYSPDTVITGGGCGGEAPHYEPYDRVYMGGTGYEEYKKSGHYQIGCTGCHNGTDNTDDKTVAHSGDFLLTCRLPTEAKAMASHRNPKEKSPYPPWEGRQHGCPPREGGHVGSTAVEIVFDANICEHLG